MCLILFANDQHPKYKLVMAANRDEFFSRPSLVADFWKDNSAILGGRDVQSGGTWLGINKNGRFIAITNFRDPDSMNPKAISRGELSSHFLSKSIDIPAFIKEVSAKRQLYNGFNLLLSDNGFDNIFHYSNISDRLTGIDPGVHGLSNHLLNTPWPKIKSGKKALVHIIQSESLKTGDLLNILQDNSESPDESLPKTGISYELEKKLSPVFISMIGYGTRCSTAILIDRNNVLSFHEVTYDEKRQIVSEKIYNIMIESSLNTNTLID